MGTTQPIMTDKKNKGGMVQIPDTDLLDRVRQHCTAFGYGIGKFFQRAGEDYLEKERATKGLPSNKPDSAP